MKRAFSIAAAVTSLMAMAASAQPVLWPESEGGTGHWYEFVAAPGIAWDTAYDLANGYYPSLNAWGYLLAINSAAENAWVLANLTTANAWIGLRQGLSQPPQPPCGNEPADGWNWWSQPPFLTYTNWCSGQPDDGGLTECFLVPHEDFGMLAPGGCWTDEVLAAEHITGYLVEYDQGLVPVDDDTWGSIKQLYR